MAAVNRLSVSVAGRPLTVTRSTDGVHVPVTITGSSVIHSFGSGAVIDTPNDKSTCTVTVSPTVPHRQPATTVMEFTPSIKATAGHRNTPSSITAVMPLTVTHSAHRETVPVTSTDGSNSTAPSSGASIFTSNCGWNCTITESSALPPSAETARATTVLVPGTSGISAWNAVPSSTASIPFTVTVTTGPAITPATVTGDSARIAPSTGEWMVTRIASVTVNTGPTASHSPIRTITGPVGALSGTRTTMSPAETDTSSKAFSPSPIQCRSGCPGSKPRP